MHVHTSTCTAARSYGRSLGGGEVFTVRMGRKTVQLQVGDMGLQVFENGTTATEWIAIAIAVAVAVAVAVSSTIGR